MSPSPPILIFSSGFRPSLKLLFETFPNTLLSFLWMPFSVWFFPGALGQSTKPQRGCQINCQQLIEWGTDLDPRMLDKVAPCNRQWLPDALKYPWLAKVEVTLRNQLARQSWREKVSEMANCTRMGISSCFVCRPHSRSSADRVGAQLNFEWYNKGDRRKDEMQRNYPRKDTETEPHTQQWTRSCVKRMPTGDHLGFPCWYDV